MLTKRNDSPSHVTGLQKDMVQIVISPLPSGMYHVRVYKDNKPFVMGPLLDSMVLSKRLLGEMVRRTAVLANRMLTMERFPVAPFQLRKSTIESFASAYIRPVAYDDFLMYLFSKKVPEQPGSQAAANSSGIQPTPLVSAMVAAAAGSSAAAASPAPAPATAAVQQPSPTTQNTGQPVFRPVDQIQPLSQPATQTGVSTPPPQQSAPLNQSPPSTNQPPSLQPPMDPSGRQPGNSSPRAPGVRVLPIPAQQPSGGQPPAQTPQLQKRPSAGTFTPMPGEQPRVSVLFPQGMESPFVDPNGNNTGNLPVATGPAPTHGMQTSASGGSLNSSGGYPTAGDNSGLSPGAPKRYGTLRSSPSDSQLPVYAAQPSPRGLPSPPGQPQPVPLTQSQPGSTSTANPGLPPRPGTPTLQPTGGAPKTFLPPVIGGPPKTAPTNPPAGANNAGQPPQEKKGGFASRLFGSKKDDSSKKK
jgi:hypothetical protein